MIKFWTFSRPNVRNFFLQVIFYFINWIAHCRNAKSTTGFFFFIKKKLFFLISHVHICIRLGAHTYTCVHCARNNNTHKKICIGVNCQSNLFYSMDWNVWVNALLRFISFCTRFFVFGSLSHFCGFVHSHTHTHTHT